MRRINLDGTGRTGSSVDDPNLYHISPGAKTEVAPQLSLDAVPCFPVVVAATVIHHSFYTSHYKHSHVAAVRDTAGVHTGQQSTSIDIATRRQTHA